MVSDMTNISGLSLGIVLIPMVAIFSQCSNKVSYDPERNFKNIERQLQARFMMVEDCSAIEIPEGHFIFTKSLILDGKKSIIIRGDGKDKTVLSFLAQKDGAEGIRIANCQDITIEGFTIEDARGDNIKVSDSKNISFRHLRSAWTGEVNEENGAYGLYPVLCDGVLIEDCEVLGASDAGIYVGQSEDVIIRNNKSYWNVAGIESENSENVEIYGNEVIHNTGGILVFDLPGLTRYGENIKVYNNVIKENNMTNFAPKGNIVGIVPPGTGILILATRRVEVYDNEVIDNKTIGAGIISYDLVATMGEEGSQSENRPGGAQPINRNYRQDPDFDPYPGAVYIHNNRFVNSHILPDLGNDFGKLFTLKFGLNRPDIAWDGITSDDYLNPDGTRNSDYRICVEEEESVKRAILDASNDFKGLTSDPKALNCEG